MSSRLCEGSCELVSTELKSLRIDRVDLVPEGANSAAFVTLYKGKEMKSMDVDEILAKMKPEHAQTIQAELDRLAKSNEELVATNAELEKACAEAKKADETEDPEKDPEKDPEVAKEGSTSFDDVESLTKGLDPQVAGFIAQLKKQKEAAEEVAKAAIAKERHAAAINKAAELKALPVAEATLVDFIEKSSDETIDMLSAIAKGIESTVLSEAGAPHDDGTFKKSSGAAWSKIESEAERVAKERGVTVAKATGMVIAEQPELYKEYLEGGAN